MIPSWFGQLGKNIVECRNAYQFSKDKINDYALKNSSIFFKVGILLTLEAIRNKICISY